MELSGCSDNPNKDIAYNIHHCVFCMLICKEDVWKNPGRLWIDENNEVTIE